MNDFLKTNHDDRRGFTLTELLAVVAILMVLMVVTFIVINPPQLLAQARDAKRISDLASLNTAIALYQSTNRNYAGYSLGSSTVAYLSVPDPTATSTSGNACTGIGMPSSTGYTYHCASSSTYLNASTTGWLPINFQNIPGGSPFGTVPVDPENQTSTNLYYTYEANGTQWTLSAFFESQKYAKNMQATGGIDPALYQVGTGINSLPEEGRGLLGYWPLKEGSGSSTYDWSGANITGTWSGNASGTSGYYLAGHVWQWGGTFDGATTLVTFGTASSSLNFAGNLTEMAWIKTTQNGEIFFDCQNNNPLTYMDIGPTTVGGTANKFVVYLRTNTGSVYVQSGNVTVNDGNWHFIAFTRNVNTKTVTLYVDGSVDTTGSYTDTGPISTSGGACTLSHAGSYQYSGSADDVRAYNRALSTAEIQEIYNAEK